MASPEWFFSTIAQVTATVVGFVLAFSAVLYQLNRQRRERRTEELREEIMEFRSLYEKPIFYLGNKLRKIIDPTEIFGCTWLQLKEYSAEELENMARNKLDLDFADSVLISAHVNRIALIISDVRASSEPESHYLWTEDEHEALKVSTEWLRDNLFLPYLSEEAYDDATTLSEHVSDIESVDDKIMVDDPAWVNLSNSQVKRLFEKYFEKGNFPDADSQIDPISEWVEIHGDGRSDFALPPGIQLLSQINQHFITINSMWDNTIVQYSTNITQIILASAFLILLGVITPLVFLIGADPTFIIGNLPYLQLIHIQLVLLSGSTICVGYLLWLVHRGI